jgi:hypothetical protein
MDAAAGGEHRFPFPAAHSASMLNGDRDGKMQWTRHWRGQTRTARNNKNAASRRKRRFRIRTSKEEIFLSLAGLAATYSPRA